MEEFKLTWEIVAVIVASITMFVLLWNQARNNRMELKADIQRVDDKVERANRFHLRISRSLGRLEGKVLGARSIEIDADDEDT